MTDYSNYLICNDIGKKELNYFDISGLIFEIFSE